MTGWKLKLKKLVPHLRQFEHQGPGVIAQRQRQAFWVGNTGSRFNLEHTPT